VRSSDTTGGEQGDALDLLEEDLIHLMVTIPYTRDEDILMWICRHTGGDRERFT
jgi:hypothetical protein